MADSTGQTVELSATRDSGPSGFTVSRRTDLLRWAFVGLLGLAVVLMLMELLRAALVAFLNLEYSRYADYAKYTNMVWNTANGHPFAWGLTGNYLQTHLSFSLAFIAPLFLLWDHPALLLVVQWTFLVGGVLFMMAAAVRHRMGAVPLMAVLCFYTAYHFTQDVMLREFHGVSAYFLLVPMLYYCVAFRRGMVWLPLLLMAGLREEAGLVAVPVLLYFAITDRWKAGYWYAGGLVLYVLLACTVIYPLINHAVLADRRQKELANAAWDVYFGANVMRDRALSFGWIVLPLIPFLKSGWGSVLSFLTIPVLITLGSLEPGQYRMEDHYPALVAAFIGISVLHVIGTRWPRAEGRTAMVWIAVAWLFGATGISFYFKGLVVGSRSAQTSTVYRSVSGPGPHVLHLALNYLPREGVLTAPKKLRCLLANRRELLWGSRRGVEFSPEASVALEETDRVEPELAAGVSNGTWRVVYTDDSYTIFQRGQGSARPAEASVPP
jgi:uncharacterized membrane protein